MKQGLTIDKFSPIGLGTPYGESLASYFLRLAESLGVMPGQLVFRILTWMDEGEVHRMGQWKRRPGRVRVGFNISSHEHAEIWRNLLARFVGGETDLSKLTTTGFEELFPTRGFSRLHLAWCPRCLASDAVPYHRLSWTLQAVRVCSVHLLLLVEKCPLCDRRVPHTHERSGVWRCPTCRGDLRVEANRQSADVYDFDLWSAHQIEHALAVTSGKFAFKTKSTQSLLRRMEREQGLGNLAEFAKRLGLSKVTVWYWFSGKADISLPAFLKICYLLGYGLGHLLNCRDGVHEMPPSPVSQPEFFLPRYRKAQEIDWSAVRQRLDEELKTGEIRSLASVCDSIGRPVRLVRSHFPELCRAIAQRARAHGQSLRLERDRLLAASIKAAIKAQLQTSATISRRAVAAALGTPGLFSRHNARRIWKEVVSEFHLH